MKALLQLKDYWIEELAWKPVENGESTEEIPPPDADLPTVRVDVFQANEGNADFAVRLALSFSAQKAKRAKTPYQYRLSLLGQFVFREGTDREVQERMIHANGSAILLGLARAALAESTGLGTRGRFIIPAINLLEVLEKRNHPIETPPASTPRT